MAYRCDWCGDLIGSEGWHGYRDMDGKVIRFCNKCNIKIEKKNLENVKLHKEDIEKEKQEANKPGEEITEIKEPVTKVMEGLSSS